MSGSARPTGSGANDAAGIPTGSGTLAGDLLSSVLFRADRAASAAGAGLVVGAVDVTDSFGARMLDQRTGAPLTAALSGVTTPGGAGANIIIETTTAGNLALNAPVNANGGTTVLGAAPGLIGLSSAGTITQAPAGLIVGAGLALSAIGDVRLGEANRLGTNDVVGIPTGSGTLAGDGLSGILFRADRAASAAGAGLAVGAVDVTDSFGARMLDQRTGTPLTAALSGMTTAGGNILVETTTAGNLALNAPVNAGAGSVGLASAGTVTQDPAPIIAASLAILSANRVSLGAFGGPADLNQVGTLAGQVLNPGESFVFRNDAATLTIGAVDVTDSLGGRLLNPVTAAPLTGPLSGVVTNNANIGLRVTASGDLVLTQTVAAGTAGIGLESAGQIRQTGGTVTGSALEVSAAGAVSLPEGNAVSLLAGQATGAGNSLLYRNEEANLTVGAVGPLLEQGASPPPASRMLSVGTLSGVTTLNGNILVETTTAGNLALNAPVNAGAGSVGLASAGTLTQDPAPIIAASLAILSANRVSLGAFGGPADLNQVGTLAGQVLNPGESFVFRNDAATLTIGSVDVTDSLGGRLLNPLTAVPLTGPLSGVVTNNANIGLRVTTSGDLLLTQNVAAGTAGIGLESAGQIRQTGGAVTASALEMSAAGAASLPDANAVPTLAARTTAAGSNLLFRDNSTTLTVGAVGPLLEQGASAPPSSRMLSVGALSGVTTSNGNLTLETTTAGDLDPRPKRRRGERPCRADRSGERDRGRRKRDRVQPDRDRRRRRDLRQCGQCGRDGDRSRGERRLRLHQRRRSDRRPDRRRRVDRRRRADPDQRRRRDLDARRRHHRRRPRDFRCRGPLCATRYGNDRCAGLCRRHDRRRHREAAHLRVRHRRQCRRRGQPWSDRRHQQPDAVRQSRRAAIGCAAVRRWRRGEREHAGRSAGPLRNRGERDLVRLDQWRRDRRRGGSRRSQPGARERLSLQQLRHRRRQLRRAAGERPGSSPDRPRHHAHSVAAVPAVQLDRLCDLRRAAPAPAGQSRPPGHQHLRRGTPVRRDAGVGRGDRGAVPMTLKQALLAVAAAIAVAGCQPPPPDAYVSGAQTEPAAEAVPVGANQVGEACRYQPISTGDFPVGASRAFALYCGAWSQASGRIFELGGGADASRLNALAAAGPWRGYINERFACGAPTDTRLAGGAPAALMQCSRRNGGWPHLAMTAAVGGRVFGADAIPSALPVLEAALGSVSGAGAPTGRQAPSEAARLIANRSVGQPFGSGDLQRFYDLTSAGDAYNNVDDPANAERAFREALAIQQRILGRDNPGLAVTMMKLAAQIAHQRNAPEADRLLEIAASLSARSKDPLVTAQLDYYRAVTAAYQHRPEEALRRARTAETEFARLLPPGTTGRAGPDFTDQALRARGIDVPLLTAEAPLVPEQETAVLGLAETLRLQAALRGDAGEPEQSTQLALRAQRLLEANALAVTSTGARSLRLVAANEAGATDFPAASGYSSQAGQVFAQVVPGERPEALNLLRHGEYRLRQGETGQALALFRRAGQILRKPGVVGVPPENILPWLDALWIEVERSPADRAQLNAEMFEAAQFAKDSLTAQDIAQTAARLAASDPKVAAALLSLQQGQRRLDGLAADRDALVAEGDRPGAADRLAALDAQIGKAQQQVGEADAEVQVAAPRYRRMLEEPVTEPETRALLRPDEALVSIFTAPGGSYGFALEREDAQVYQIPLKGAEIAALIGQLRQSSLPRAVAGQAVLPNYDTAAAYRLYAALIGPAAKALDGKSRVTIAAGGALLSFPFAALVTAPDVGVANGDYRQTPWLLRRFALSYVPAPRTFVDLRRIKSGSPGSRPFIGFGDFQPATDRQIAALFPAGRCAQDNRNLHLLGPLPGTRTEVTTLGRELGAAPGDIVLGAAFTKARVTGADLGRYRIVHFATHALLPTELGQCQTEPAILTSTPPGAPSAGAGFLGVGDIENLKLDADLVVLSACDTAGPGNGAGESLSGLARAFFLAGTRGMLVTHWAAADIAAMRLMTGALAPGAGGATEDTAQALRSAQLRMIDTAGGGADTPMLMSAPFAWAPFVLIGDGVRARAPGA